MNESYVMENYDLDVEVIYTEEELDAIYKEYEERVVKKALHKIWCKEFFK